MESPPKTRKPRWQAIPLRVLLVTFLLTLFSFAVSLLLSILGVVIAAKVHGAHPDMRIAYRKIALPVAMVAGSIVLILSIVMEIRHYRQSKTLNGIVRASR
jgi:amino acid transporter